MGITEKEWKGQAMLGKTSLGSALPQIHLGEKFWCMVLRIDVHVNINMFIVYFSSHTQYLLLRNSYVVVI